MRRLATFIGWPRKDITPQSLAAAGFFYAPNNKQGSDRVVCFKCHNALFNWDQGDDPWKEHKNW